MLPICKQQTQPAHEDFSWNGYWVIDKPTDWTSFDVVNKLRYFTKQKKVGHMGTLDPIATGVLVLAIGKPYTSQLQHWMGLKKKYLVTWQFGQSSDTYDRTGEITLHSALLPSLAQVEEALESFYGHTQQIPPVYSSKKVRGVPAHRRVRGGQSVELAPVEVWMQGENLQDLGAGRFSLELEVSSGTYIRSFVHDLGVKLACGALMTDLRRTCVGDFTLEEAITLDQFLDSSLPKTYYSHL